ncbi:MAG TPA: helix-turn-helix transcriptional regulator [Acidimicrobiales bacterium]|jgi:transcriptional regulator with XRE-family HTH domain
MTNFRLTPDERTVMGERLHAARKLAGLTLREVAATAGVSTNTVDSWEHGSLPSLPAMRALLAELYGQPQEVLFAEHETKMEAARALLRPA